MSRNALHTEENFWPSVSDMFLTLFVIALVLYSTANREKGAGDLFIEQQATLAATELVSDLKVACPDDAVVRTFDVEQLKSEDVKGNPRPVLAGYVMDIVEKSDQRDEFRLGNYSPDDIQEARKDYRKAIALAYNSCQSLVDTEMPVQPSDQLRKVSKAMLAAIDRKNINTARTPEQLKKALEDARARIAMLQEQLSRSVTKEEYAKLQAKIKELEDIIAKSGDVQKLHDEITRLKARIAELEKEKTELNGKIGSLTMDNTNLRSRLNEDTRRRVMGNVQKILQQSGLTDYVQIEQDLAIIRIPSSSVSFPSGVYKRFSGTEVLSRMANALIAIAEANNADNLIDNIVIECHADTDGDAFENEILSSNRALYIWKCLNDKSAHRLENYKNSSGLGLFSHAGFGCRVPVRAQAGENTESAAYKERCRRIDIRFNCSPVKGEGTH